MSKEVFEKYKKPRRAAEEIEDVKQGFGKIKGAKNCSVKKSKMSKNLR